MIKVQQIVTKEIQQRYAAFTQVSKVQYNNITTLELSLQNIALDHCNFRALYTEHSRGGSPLGVTSQL